MAHNAVEEWINAGRQEVEHTGYVGQYGVNVPE